MTASPSHYHVHVYYDERSRPSAAAFRGAIAGEFGGRVRVHPMIDRPIGPHPLPMFEVDVPAGELVAVTAWLRAHHGEHSILLHPLTGDDLADHRDYPEWIGPPLPLDLTILGG